MWYASWHTTDTSPKEFLFIMAFVVPCISIVVCYARIFYIVRKTAMRSHDSAGTLGNNTSMHIQATTNGNNQQTTKKLFVSNNNRKPSDGTDIQLLPKVSNGSITPNANSRRCGNGKSLLDNSDISSTVSHSHSQNDLKSSLKFIDTSVESDFPPTLSALRKYTLDEKKLSGADRISSNVSICRTVEFIDGNGERRTSFDRDCSVKTMMMHDNDSAVEESTSSADNNQVNLHRIRVNSCN